MTTITLGSNKQLFRLVLWVVVVASASARFHQHYSHHAGATLSVQGSWSQVQPRSLQQAQRRTIKRRISRYSTTAHSSSRTKHHQLAFVLPSSLLLTTAADAAPLLSEPALWLLRISSAATTYIAAITYFDRPQGQLNVDIDRDVEIKQSTVTGAGLGLFACCALPRGTILGTYPGAVLPLQQNLSKLAQYPACEGYIWRFSDNLRVLDPTDSNGILQMTCAGGNPAFPGSVWLFENVYSSNLFNIQTALCRINEPPSGRDVNVVTDENRERRTVTFELERDVVAGEEFFIDYGLSYDRTMYGGK